MWSYTYFFPVASFFLFQVQAIVANDIHPMSIELAIRSAAAAGVQRMIKFSCRDVADLTELLPNKGESNLSFFLSFIHSQKKYILTFLTLTVLNIAGTQYPDLIITNPPWDKRLSEAEESWYKLADFALRIWQSSSSGSSSGGSSGSSSLLPRRYPLWILSGNERLREYFDYELRDKPNYVHNLKAHSGLMQLLKYFIKERVK